uniref:Uncharacterized protein n=1 Tax=Setaria italica TaxID=4555 RepID=K4AHX3_SETIT
MLVYMESVSREAKQCHDIHHKCFNSIYEKHYLCGKEKTTDDEEPPKALRGRLVLS